MATIYAVGAGLSFAGGDYKRAAIAGLICATWALFGLKLRKDDLPLKSIVYMFLALAAVYLLSGVDFFMQEKFMFAGFNGAAFIATLGVAIWVNRKR